VTSCGDVVIDDDAHTVTKSGSLVDLSPTEYRLLLFLVKSAGKVLTRWQILDHVWTTASKVSPRSSNRTSPNCERRSTRRRRRLSERFEVSAIELSDRDVEVSLRLRLTFAASLLLAVLLLLGVLLVSSVGKSELRQVDQQLKNSLPVARTLDQTASPTFPSLVTSPKTFTANRFSAFYIAVVKKGQRSVISTPLDAQSSHANSICRHNPRPPNKDLHRGIGLRFLQWRAVLLAVPHSKTEVLVAVSLGQVDTTMSFLRLAILFAGLIVLAVVVATGFWIARLGLRPIAEVTEVADAITAVIGLDA